MTYPKVAIIMLNWNNFDDVKECLDSLAKITYPDYEAIIVDNGSVDDSADRIGREYPRHTLIRNKQNEGFARGNNVGIRYALDKGIGFIMLINDDTVVDPGFLEPEMDILLKDDSVGIVGGKIYYYSDPKKIWAAGGMMKKSWLYGDGPALIGFNEIDQGQFDKTCEVDWCVGALMLIRRQTFEKIGLLPECYFQCGEESDFQLMARRAGIRIMYSHESMIWHKIGFSNHKSPRNVYNYYRNKLMFMKRNRSFIGWHLWFLVFKLFVFWFVFILGKVPRTWKGIEPAIFRKAIRLALEDFKLKPIITEEDFNRAGKILAGEMGQ